MGATSAHFSEKELACRHCGKNECTTELVQALEAFRVEVGNKPVIVNDAYRCSVHNAEVGGVPDSQHVLGQAADIMVIGMTAAQLYNAAVIIPAIKGLGRDDHKNYIHVDVRSNFARWCYGTNGKQIAWYDPPEESSEVKV